MAVNGCKWLEIPGNSWKLLEITGMTGNGWKWLDMAEMAGNGYLFWPLVLDMT